MLSSNILKKIKGKITSKPGVYIFTDSKNKKLYIGKASNLKRRLLSYLKTKDQRILKMLSLAKKINIIESDSEIEAIILESKYIKKYKPVFNIMLRDDKNFFYIGFTKENFPKIFITHQPHKLQIINSNTQTGSKIQNTQNTNQKQNYKKLETQNWKSLSASIEWIGPFVDGTALKTTLKYLRKIFPYCTCKKPHNNFCLNYHIGKCLGLCCLKENSLQKNKLPLLDYETIYKRNIKSIKEILLGKKDSLLKDLEKEMIKFGKKQQFEKAIELRDKIEKIKKVFENAKIIKTFDQKNEELITDLENILELKELPNRIESYDIANIQGQHAVGVMVVFNLKQDSNQINYVPNKNEYRKFKIYTQKSPNDTGMLKEVLMRRFKHTEWPIPDVILIDGGKGQLNSAHSVITNQSLNLNSKKIKIIALTKDRKHKGVKIYIWGKSKPIFLSNLSEDFKKLILNLDSEAHKLAINYYRLVHRRSLDK
jgi:excinuclease ABC subunit C